MQKKSSKTSLQNTKDIALSIQFSLDGFSFCITDTKRKEIVYFTSYLFDETLKSPKDLLDEIKVIFNKDKNLQHDFSAIEVIHENYLSTLVPELYFNENSLQNYLSYTVKTFKNDFITYDSIDLIEAKNVYIPYVNINNYIFQNFGEFEYKHHHTILLQKLLSKKPSDEKVMYVNVAKNNFDIVVLEEEAVVFLNSFTYQTKEDFLYHILFTAEQLQLDTEEFQLMFLGAISKNSDIYKITHNYVRNVSYLESKNEIFNNLELQNHSNYILLG